MKIEVRMGSSRRRREHASVFYLTVSKVWAERMVWIGLRSTAAR
jgi:hypothetical protein